MNRCIITTGLVFVLAIQAISQSKVVPVSKSELSGIDLPNGSKKDNRLWVTAAARVLLKMKAEENKMTLGDKVEVFILPPATGNQIIEQVKLAAQKAGWEIRPFSDEPTYALIINKDGSLLMCLESQKNETSLYMSPVSLAVEKAEETKPMVAAQAELKPQQQVKESVAPMIEAKPEAVKESIAPVVPTKAKEVVGTGYTFSTINFDDGWTSTIADDYVQVAKGNLLVLIYYSSEITDEMRYSNLEISEIFWNKLVVPNYIVKSAQRLNESLTFFRTYFIEGDVVEPKTGKPLYLAMTVLMNSGIATPVLAIATDRNSYLQQFPEPKNLGGMTGYNRFAISAKDIVGNWTASSGAGVHLYNTNTGNYAGMNYAQSSDQFTFHADGTYSSKHSGASSVYGTTTVYTQEYKGKLTVTNWDVSMTNRFKDATENFHAWFEVVKGGRILHLQNKSASAIQYNLVKDK
jgi:hypothetical protein